MKHNPRLNEKVARLPGFADVHPLQPQETVQGALRGDQRARLLAARPHRHAWRGDEPQGGGAWRAVRSAVHPRRARSARRQARGRAGAGERARHQPGDRGLRRLSRREHPRQRRRPRRSRSAEGAARARRRGGDDHQPEHLRAVRAGHEGDQRRGACGRRASFIATARTSTRSSARCARATSASTRCTSTCTRPSRPRTAAAVRARGRSCCRRRCRPTARCRSPRNIRTAASRSSRRKRPTTSIPRPSGGWSPSTGRWACSPARWPTSSATAPTA